MRQPEFWRRNSPGARITRAALVPLGLLYGASVDWKKRHSRPYRAAVPVICVGNLTVGGSGKTPVAIAIAKLLQREGLSPAFLSRGYGRRTTGTFLVDPEANDASSAGDEALLLARVAPTIVSIDRARGARMAESLGANAIIMDDGHQNFSLHKDLSLVVVDGEAGFGNGRIVPAGPLRESVQQGLDRADAVVVIGGGDPRLAGFAGPVLQARLSAAGRLDRQRVVAFAGIGRPEKFFVTLREAGAELVETRIFADHHTYSRTDIARLKRSAAGANAALVTTEKDFMRLASAERRDVQVFPVYIVFDDEAAVAKLIASLMAPVASEK